MGSDIRGVVELRVGDKWICVNTLSPVRTGPAWDDLHYPRCLARNHKRFEAMASAAGPRGLPTDISDTGRFFAQEYRDGVRHSWLPLQEAARIMLETERDPKVQSAASDDPCHYYFDEIPQYAGNCRFVFWFDQ